MLKKMKLILLLSSLSICLCLMSNTYSRYVADANGTVAGSLAKWQILIGTQDITNNSQSEISFVPIILPNDNVKNGVVAPSSKGYFDIAVDPSNVEVSFKYSITLDVQNQNIQDIIVNKYSIIPNDFNPEEDTLSEVEVSGNIIINDVLFDNSVQDFKFNSFTIRVYFEWFEGEDEVMDDDADSLAGTTAVTENTTFSINANINFEQIIQSSQQTPEIQPAQVSELPQNNQVD